MKTIETLECGHPESPHESFTSGFGRDKDGNRHCYECCAKQDRQQMRDAGKITLYLTSEPNPSHATCGMINRNPVRHYVSNWPGSLKLACHHWTRGRHNIARVRYDVWFTFEGQSWHGVQYGDNTQLCHCRRINS